MKLTLKVESQIKDKGTTTSKFGTRERYNKVACSKAPFTLKIASKVHTTSKGKQPQSITTGIHHMRFLNVKVSGILFWNVLIGR